MNVYFSGSGCLTADELDNYSRSVAAYLSERNVRTAAIITGKSPFVFAAIRACLMAGVCYIPVDESLPAQRLDIITRGADILLCDGDNGTMTDIRSIAGRSAAFTPTIADPSLPAYRIYTSGTTGEPKGIEVSRGNVGNFLRWFCGIPAIAETKPRSVLGQARFSFDLSVADIYYSLCTGARLTVIERELTEDCAGLFGRMGESGAELAVLTPSFAELCLCDSAFSERLMPRLRVMFFCGEVLKPATAEKLFRRFPRARIINAYGPSECCCAVTAAEITTEMTSGALPIGDMAHTAGRVDVTDGGEIVIYGGSVARYIDGQGGFGEHGGERCFYTGDSGYIRDGMLYFGGRRDRQVKIMGCRVEPEDVENNILKTGLAEQAAVSAELLGGHMILTALVKPCGGASAADIRRALCGLVPKYMIPRKITVVGEIPINKNGKTERKLP
ncbi:MAG: AMP-binding protein [Oscillospiraceae bacterium]